MSLTVGIVDYQMGNLRSVAKAIEKIGATAIVSSDPTELEKASHLILPGVGAIGDAIRELKQRNLVPWIKDWIRSDRPFLGICLGMQLLFDYSEEGGRHEGLSILPGRVIRFRNEGHVEWEHRKIPHMGWNPVWSNRHDDEMLEGSETTHFSILCIVTMWYRTIRIVFGCNVNTDIAFVPRFELGT